MKYRKAIFVVAYALTKKGVEGVEYLILKRKLHWRGWEFPKGGVKFSETERKAVKRELFEETGFKPLHIKKFGFSGKYDYEKIFPDRPGIKGQRFQLYAVQVKKSKAKVDNGEHNDFRWVKFPRALKMLTFPNQKKSLEIVNEWLKEKSH